MPDWGQPNADRSPIRRPLKVFLSYSHIDEQFRQRFEVHLAPFINHGFLELWHDGKILAGQSWDPKIGEKLETADLILFLVTPDFYNSEYIREIEVPQALLRHQAGTAFVVPILVKGKLWSFHPLSRLQTLPAHKRPVENGDWTIDDAFCEVTDGLRELIEVFRTKEAPTTFSAQPPANEDPEIACVHFVYAPDDLDAFNHLYKHLYPIEATRFLRISHDGLYTLDRTKSAKLQRSLESADLIVPILTENLLANAEFCDTLLPLMLSRQEQELCLVTPVIAKPCNWQFTALSDCRVVLPTDSTPLCEAPSREERFIQTARDIAELVRAIVYQQ
jgi:TIR domain